MCASVYSSLLLFLLYTTLTISIMCGPQMATGGLPYGRRERGADQDILAGADFLSILIESSLRRDYSQTTTPTTVIDLQDYSLQDAVINYVRTPRETSPIAQTSTETQSDLQDPILVSDSDTGSSDSDGVVVGVSVSSSVGRTVNRDRKYTSTLSETLTEPPTTELLDQNFVASEEHPSIVAEASKSELTVEESEPVMRDSHADFGQGYPAMVRQLTGPYHSHDGFPTGVSQQKPIHSTLIFHNRPQDSRSVSYSTVIQHPHLQSEMEQHPQQHERRERNYNGAQSIFLNNYNLNENSKRRLNNTKIPSPLSFVPQSNEMVVTSSTQRNWEEDDEHLDDSAKIDAVTTERNWEIQEKPYSPSPISAPKMHKVYSQPEQNYEVDEAVSVVTNGRAHGIQPSLPPGKVEQRNSTKKDDNQKVGYVVEGKNYRKYRVEERTADGFIVGEYGVVSHDDGSLRGVRYTADGTINPRLIYDALMKFLSL